MALTKSKLKQSEFSSNRSSFGGEADWLYGGHDLQSWYQMRDERQAARDAAGFAEACLVCRALERKNGIC
jgi:hypothetical protein